MTSDSKTLPEHVLEGFRAGDTSSVRYIYQLFSRPVATVARSVVGPDQALIDDIVQQTFTKAWRAAKTFDSNRSFAPWLYTIARRTAIDAVRAERRPTKGDHDEIIDIAVESSTMESAWEAYEVRLAIQRLPVEEQEVIKLGHMMGYTHGQISERLGIPLGTVKSRSHRAHRKLLPMLQHLQDDPSQPSSTQQQGRPQ